MEQARSYHSERWNFWYFQKQYPQIYYTYPNYFFNCSNHKGIRLTTRLRIGPSHRREHKFNHDCHNYINPLCSCGIDIESTSHFFLHCPFIDDKRITLLSTLETNESSLTKTLLLSNSLLDLKKKLPYP